MWVCDDIFLCTEAAVSETRSTQNIQPVYEQISAAFSSVNGLLVRGVRWLYCLRAVMHICQKPQSGDPCAGVPHTSYISFTFCWPDSCLFRPSSICILVTCSNYDTHVCLIGVRILANRRGTCALTRVPFSVYSYKIKKNKGWKFCLYNLG